MKDITKKLQKLVKTRKTPVVVTEQGSVKAVSKRKDSGSAESYCYSSYNNT